MKRHQCAFLLFLILLTAWSAPPPPAATITPFPTRVLPTATRTPPPSVLAGTPVFIPETAISVDNLNRLTLLARWGKGSVVQVKLSPDGQVTAVATPIGVYLYDSESFEEKAFIESKGWLNCIAFSPDGKLLALGSLDGSIRVLQLSDSMTQKIFNSPLGAITSLTFSPTGSSLAAGDTSGGVYLLDMATQATRTLAGHKARIHSLVFTPAGETLVSGSNDLQRSE